jgi:hypothetical protein
MLDVFFPALLQVAPGMAEILADTPWSGGVFTPETPYNRLI